MREAGTKYPLFQNMNYTFSAFILKMANLSTKELQF